MNPEFLRDLDWVTSQMPRTARAIAALPDLSGVRLACSMHLEIKMAPAMLGLLQRGAELFLITCNPATVSDPFVEYCTAQGARAFAARCGRGRCRPWSGTSRLLSGNFIMPTSDSFSCLHGEISTANTLGASLTVTGSRRILRTVTLPQWTTQRPSAKPPSCGW